MATLELVERLREYADVSYAEASEALDACNDDILEAIVYLEEQGKVQRPQNQQTQDAHYTTKSQSPPEFTPRAPKEETFGDLLQRFFHWVGQMIKKSMNNNFTVYKNGKASFSMPILILILCLFFSAGLVFVLMILGLFFGYSYAFGGADLEDKNPVNHAMDSASRTADEIKISIKNSQKKDQDTDENNPQ